MADAKVITEPAVEVDPDLPVFLKLSEKLTGFSEEDLQGTGMLETYYYVLMKEQDQEGIRAFFKKADQVLKNSDVHAEIKAAFIDLPDTATRPQTPFDQMQYEGLAQRIILLWYTGIWTTMNWKDKLSQNARTAMVSAEAYKEGLIWVAAETHPAGAKQPGYGSWSRKPLSKTERT
jgi:hypothetical protein